MSENLNSVPKRSALGKGIGALIGGSGEQAPSGSKIPSSDQQNSNNNSMMRVDPKQIDPNPEQPRKIFKEEEMKELAESLKVDGVIQPLVVTRSGSQNRYTLIAGERRLRASLAAGLKTVPVVLRDSSPGEMLRIALIENIQRSDLNIIEEASAYENLINKHGLTQEQCAQQVGKDRSSVTNAMRLLSLPMKIKNDLIQNSLSFGHAKVLLSLENAELILKAREIIHKKALNVRQTEKICKLLRDQGSLEEKKEDPDLEYLANNLREHLRTKVRLQGNGSRGKIEISYFSASELERVLELIGPH